MEEFKDFIFDELQRYEKAQGRRINQDDFADYLGVDRPLISNWLSGKTKSPSSTNIQKIADKLGPKIYDVLGLNPPPAYFQSREIQAIYDATPPERRDELIEEMKTWVAENDFVISEIVDPPDV